MQDFGTSDESSEFPPKIFCHVSGTSLVVYGTCLTHVESRMHAVLSVFFFGVPPLWVKQCFC